MPFETARLAGNLERYQAEQLPGFEQMFTWSLLQAPTVQGISAFRDYPAARPY